MVNIVEHLQEKLAPAITYVIAATVYNLSLDLSFIY